MALDLQDQEELENFKRVWASWGKWFFYILVLVALAYLGRVIWLGYTERQNEEAVQLMETQFLTKANSGDEKGKLLALQKLQKDYPNTTSTTQATLMLAGEEFDKAKYAEAEKHLLWVKKHQNNPFIQFLVIKRLAAVYLEEKKYDEAHKILATKVDPAFEAHILDFQGDVFAAEGKADMAKQRYQAALKLMPEGSIDHSYIEIKSNL